MLDKLKNSFLRHYLDYVEDTESPRIFHIWAALSGVGACLGRRCYIPFGPNEIYANQYVLLVGPPGARKSSAVKVLARLLKKGTGVRFAPDDMGGQRQGLLRVMEGDTKLSEEEVMINGQLDAGLAAADLDAIGSINLKVDSRDAHVMFAAATEFAPFIGQNAKTLLAFLIKVWDGDDYDYELRNSEHTLRDPLLGILGATNPTDIVSCLPPEAMGQGLMSRIVFVFANKPYKDIPLPKDLDRDKRDVIVDLFRHLYYEFDGEMHLNADAVNKIHELYRYVVQIKDTRFVHYEQRRQVHLLKVALNLAASELRNVITGEDIQTAHEILAYTEEFMPDALGEFGLSPLTKAKQDLLEFIQNCRGPVGVPILWAVMQRDMRQVDFLNTLRDFENSGKIMSIELNDGTNGYVYRDKHDGLAERLEGHM